MQIATIFSGIGVAELAAYKVFGYVKLAFACEIDKFARMSYSANHKISQERFYRDVCELPAKKYKGKIDILIGGSPCQDFSVAGLRKGEAGARGNLIWQYYRVIKETTPKIFIFENVKGFLSINGGASFERFIQAFIELGYFCKWQVLNTKDYGIPQNRERVYVVGFLDFSSYFAFNFAPKIPLQTSLKDFLDENVDKKFYLSDKTRAKFRPTRCILSSSGKGGGNMPKIIQRGRGFNKGGEFKWSPTINSSGFKNNNALFFDGEFRALTPRECLRLQGISDDFKIVVSDTQIYKQAGNAMSQNVIEMILNQICLSENLTGNAMQILNIGGIDEYRNF